MTPEEIQRDVKKADWWKESDNKKREYNSKKEREEAAVMRWFKKYGLEKTEDIINKQLKGEEKKKYLSLSKDIINRVLWRVK